MTDSRSSEQIQEPLLQQKEGEAQPEPKPLKIESFFSLFRYADASDKLHILIGTICSVAAGVCFPFFMIFFGDILTVFIEPNRANAASNAFDVTVKFFIIGAATWLLSFGGLYCWNISGSRQALRFKKMYYSTLLEQEIGWYDSNDVNKLATEVATNIAHIETAIGQKCFIFTASAITSVFGFFYAYIRCWQLSLVLTGTLPFMIIAGVLLMKALASMAIISKTSYEDAASRAQQAFGAIKTIKSLVGESYEEKLFVEALDKGKSKNSKPTLFSAISLACVNLFFLSVYSLGFYYAKELIIGEGYEAGVVVGTFFCFIVGGSTVGQLSPIAKNFAEGKVAVSKLYALMRRKKTLNEDIKDAKKIKTIKTIEFKNVNFAYRKVPDEGEDESMKEASSNLSEASIKEQNIVLNDINLKIEKNKVTALVGESGSGKSTMSQLLMRFYDPTAGQVLINDTPLDQIDIEKFRRKIGFVGQEPVLFAMTIEENLKLADPKLTEDQIVSILKQANAWEFVQKLQKGIHTYVGSGGSTQLSGGQKQRIAIARAICKNPQLLILDEATSALDRKNEREIQETLKNLSKEEITTVVIAHRLSTIRNADCISVMNKGRIVERGTHDSLIASEEGMYYTLVKSQLNADEQVEANLEQVESDLAKETPEMIMKKESEQEKPEDPEKAVEDKAQKEKQDKVFGKVFKMGSKHNTFLFLGVLFAFCNGGIWPFFNVAFSNLLSLMNDAAANNDQINQYCLLFLAVAVIGSFTTFMYKYMLDIYGQRLVYDIRVAIFGKLLRLPVSFYDKKENTPGAISTKVQNDAYQLHNMISGVFAVVCLNFSTVSLSLFFAFYNSWQLTLIVMGISPLIVVSGAINMAVLKKLISQTEETEKFIGTLISDTVTNMRTVKSFGNNQIFNEKYTEKLMKLANLNSEKALKSSFFEGMGRGMIMVVEGLAFFIAGILYENSVIDDSSSIYIAIFAIIFAAMGVGQNSAFMPDMAKAKVAGVSIFDIIETQNETTISELNGGIEPCKPQDIKGSIEFRNVTFKYPERDAVVLENFSIKIEQGSKVAFVGPSGSGKSTIAQIIQRFYPLQSGEVLINGKDISRFDLHSYRKQIGYVNQEPTLFNGTVKENIQYDQQFSQEQIEKYVEATHAKKFISEWDEGFEKQVGNKGSEVSGGQKQRIALTRCLIRKPEMFVFDEATSALDMDTEKIVFENFKPILKDRTSISIAHRLATIEDANQVIVMREGQIIEQGGYEELMDKKEHFYRLAQGE